MKYEVKPKLLSILKERKLTQLQLSEKAGIPQGSISRFDKSSQHTDTHLFAIADALDLKIEDLFEVKKNEK
ncbi:helix-turn-helix transcriptional regulator [Fictibacillus terranigra]|uniref:Helix-turn-helix transcriptional regulator n=1 Tax=Fictibacillus terranigra TaxID=3058424 RepID=A0ABT8E6V4_9BACL|nr:helix-turn-helix transcriptional regulator [Fictibacillus sp. CENA-BCM004]MDN4073636.1 helix-turn-helix transcriptional regulator [Fictibacillus sp. CENA-BCM004]